MILKWDWIKDDKIGFQRFQQGLLVAPILQKLILNREPEKVLDWVKRVSRWSFTRIIPCHLANDVKATPSEFVKAFDFLYESSSPTTNSFLSLFIKKKSPVINEDLLFLDQVSKQLTKQGVLYEEAPLFRR